MRTRTLRALAGGCAGVVLILGVVGCSDGAGPFGPDVRVELPGRQLDSVEAIDGAARTSVDGVSILVPAGVTTTQSKVSDAVTQLVLTEAGQTRALAIVTVTRALETQVGAMQFGDSKVDDEAVDKVAAVSRAQLAESGIFKETEQFSATYAGLGHAIVLRGTLAAPEGAKDVILVTTRTPDGTRAVGVSAEAPEGQLSGSLAEQVLSSVKVD